MSSYTYSNTFTITHAKYLASKVATDLKRIQRFYSYPSDSDIKDYEEEIAQLLKQGYLKEVTYGFKRASQWIEPTVRYTAKELASSTIDDDPGKIRPGADVSEASFYSYLSYSDAFFSMPIDDQKRFKESLPILRTGADSPGVDGYFSNDQSYYSGGKGLDRFNLKKY